MLSKVRRLFLQKEDLDGKPIYVYGYVIQEYQGILDRKKIIGLEYSHSTYQVHTYIYGFPLTSNLKISCYE